jgi:hypothetical protein
MKAGVDTRLGSSVTRPGEHLPCMSGEVQAGSNKNWCPATVLLLS